MVSAASLALPCHASNEDEAAPFRVSFGDVLRLPESRRRLSRALSKCALEPPDPRLTWLNQLDFRDTCAIAHFEPGCGTLEQRAQHGVRGDRRLPLPFLWSLRTINAAVFAELPPGFREFSVRSVLTIGGGEARLNAALIDFGAETPNEVELAPRCLTRTFAHCVLGRDSANQRRILPSSVLETLARPRKLPRAETSWQAERAALRALEQRLVGRFFIAPELTPCSMKDRVRRQLSLLGALEKVEGKSAVERYFVSNLERFGAQPEFCAALSAWRSEGKLYSYDGQAGTRHEAQLARETASRARVAQARLELRLRDRMAALALAVDAVCAAPELPEPWLLLGEMRTPVALGSAALCFSEAICAARGASETVALVRAQLGLKSEAELATYFRAHGDFVLARWLEPEARRMFSSLPTIRH